MANQVQHIILLYCRQLKGEQLTPAEMDILATWSEQSLYTKEISELLADDNRFDHELRMRLQEDYTEQWNVLTGRINQDQTLKRSPLKIMFRLARVAAVILLFGVGAYLWFRKSNDKKDITSINLSMQNDVMPGKHKATLTLANGDEIMLDTVANGQLAVQHGSIVKKQDDQVIYDAGRVDGETVSYNTMSTPRGGQYLLTLPDGTKAWLNAASSITYPTVFIGSHREVKITGEVYFEIAKNAKIPFIVRVHSDNIQVLGTEFNIHAYPEDGPVKTTLIGGSVKINEKILRPGQAYIDGKISQADIQRDIAWKNGIFSFEKATLKDVLQQLARWYDVEVQYPANLAEKKFGGEMPRDLTLNQVLKSFDGVGMHFRLQGRTIIVTP